MVELIGLLKFFETDQYMMETIELHMHEKRDLVLIFTLDKILGGRNAFK